jgi:hypothetical protein
VARVTAATLAALLQACESPPPVAEPAPSAVKHLRNEPHRAAVCVARNVDSYRSPYTAHIRQGTPPALVEVEVRGRESVAVVEFLEENDGSAARIRRPPAPAHGVDELIEAVLTGC